MFLTSSCPDCDSSGRPLNRRDFVKVGATSAVAAGVLTGGLARGEEKPVSRPEPETLVEKLYHSLNETQRARICFPWDHTDDRGLLRTHVSNNWSITDRDKLKVGGDFFTADQRDMIEAIFFGLYNPEWHDRIRQQLKDDAGGYGKAQAIAIFGEPGKGKFEFVMTGRHLTIRCDGNTSDHVAFGGPIFYGHAAKGFNEEKTHPGNVFWPQALKANALCNILDGKQREKALIKDLPSESEVPFQGEKGMFPGLPIGEMTADQKTVAQDVLKSLIEPYRQSDKDEVVKCLEKQGGLDRCSLAFFQWEDVGEDQVWDNWRIEGPSFVWYFRGAPHVHVWVNVADSPDVKLNAVG
ncbi:MAG: DUF3500 domain-containing protein [Planctomycetota bacterium]|nr:MAG: DUF3500 domain-containing protein [Planctomycetota bacterium]